MKWRIQSETATMRIYENDTNSSTIQTDLIHTDKMGNKWYGFYDLFSIPYLRIAYSKTISDLFGIGLTVDDLKKWIANEKKILKSNDPEKYEKLYAAVLEKEQAITGAIDPIQQHLAIATIYVLSSTEQIDFYSPTIAEQKLQLWKLDQDAQSFFLSWHIERMANYTKHLSNPSPIVSTKAKGAKRNLWE